MVCFINSISLVEKGSNFDEKYHDAVEQVNFRGSNR
jgi:hypothetical protein|tara:strand:+ start:461 stop:568 length:108 start_codon:yes stop_codon:yes gene_type:complete